MTLQERIAQKYMNQAVEEFNSNPLSLGFLRRLANEAPGIFFPEAIRHLKSNDKSNAHRFLTILTLRFDDLTDYLADPTNAPRDVATKLLKRFLAVDPSFDVRLAHKLPDRVHANSAIAFDSAKSTRALDILDETSRGRRLVPILGHLPASSDSKIAAKATLFVGRRVQSPAWSAKHLSSTDQRIRANAVESLWGLNTPPAIKLLENCTEDKNNRVVGNALVGLHVTGHREVEAQIRALARDSGSLLRTTAAWTMGRIGQTKWIESLTQMIKDEDPHVRSMALRSLTEIRRLESGTAEAIAAKAAGASSAVKAATVQRAAESLLGETSDFLVAESKTAPLTSRV